MILGESSSYTEYDIRGLAIYAKPFTFIHLVYTWEPKSTPRLTSHEQTANDTGASAPAWSPSFYTRKWVERLVEKPLPLAGLLCESLSYGCMELRPYLLHLAYLLANSLRLASWLSL